MDKLKILRDGFIAVAWRVVVVFAAVIFLARCAAFSFNMHDDWFFAIGVLCFLGVPVSLVYGGFWIAHAVVKIINKLEGTQ